MPFQDHSKTIYAIQHLAFEDLGTLEDVFYAAGYRVRYFEAGVDDLATAFAHPELLVILGGPIGVYETDDYPFLKDELILLKQRLASNKPTLGICLGAQMIAQALGARVYAGAHKEIGWSSLQMHDVAQNPLAALTDVPVLHWHGDTFDVPEQAELLASSSIYPNQAFRVGHNILALQFHIEVAADAIERWLIGHTCELRKANIDIPALRAESLKYGKNLADACPNVIQQFLSHMKT